MRTIDLHRFDEFHQGQMIGLLRAATSMISSVRDFQYGATASEKDELRKAQEIIEKIIYRYGEEDKKE